LLKILLAAAPTSKAKTESVNILADLLPEEMPYVSMHFLPLLMAVMNISTLKYHDFSAVQFLRSFAMDLLLKVQSSDFILSVDFFKINPRIVRGMRLDPSFCSWINVLRA
jgi:hypothetical protein